MKRQQNIIGQSALNLLYGAASAAVVCIVGAILISQGIVPQKWDVVIAAAALFLWNVVSLSLQLRQGRMKKWFTALITEGSILAICLIGNLLTADPDLDLLLCNSLLLLCSCLITLLFTGKKGRHYRIRY